MPEISYDRHANIFSPIRFNKQIHIIGAGSLGSHIAMSLAKRGATDIDVYDDDFVENHNPANQLYGWVNLLENRGPIKKVEALYDNIKRETDLQIGTVDDRVESGKDYKFSGIVFLCVDSMASRKEIFDKFIRMNMMVDLMIEVRAGSESGRIYTISPFNIEDVREYEKTLYSDEEAENDICSNNPFGTLAEVIGGIAAHKVTKLYRGLPWQKEVIVSLNPLIVITRTW